MVEVMSVGSVQLCVLRVARVLVVRGDDRRREWWRVSSEVNDLNACVILVPSASFWLTARSSALGSSASAVAAVRLDPALGRNSEPKSSLKW